MIRVGTRINVRPHARKKQVWGKVVLERVVEQLYHRNNRCKGNTLHNSIAGMCSYHFILFGSTRLFLCWVCEYSPDSSIYGYGKDCSETICAIAKCIKNRY